MSVLRLAIPSPLRRLFDYLPPADLGADEAAALPAGSRLLVPFGRRKVVGVLVALTDEPALPRDQLKAAAQVLDQQSLLPASLLQLCQWAAKYYQHPPGEVLMAAFPARLRQGEAHTTGGEPGWRLSTRGQGLPAGALARSPRQAQVLASLQGQARVSAAQLKAGGISNGILRALEQKGLIERCQLPVAQSSPRAQPGLALNGDQASAVDAIAASAGSFACHLVEGVTGSGKTEVYLQLIAQCLAAGKQALVLIPEIGLTPQTLRRFEQRFDAGIVVLHSGLSDNERYRAWEAARDGGAAIVIGTRSAIFTPLQRPGLIIVDEEHDASYKQQDGFRYSARDVAVKRAQIEHCPVVLGSATPSLESLHNAQQGRYQLQLLTERAGSGELPTIRAMDVRREVLQAGLSAELVSLVEQTLQRGEQSLLFLNRRGYAPALQCHDCGWIAECTACDTRLTVHRRQRRLRCHHCCASQRLPQSCQHCRSRALITNGLGTEQVEEYLRQRFPSHDLHRVDSDSMQGRDAMGQLVETVNRGQPCILLGTQMLTKGHHFPAVSLVAVIDADALLFSADFRGEERMAQLLTQVAGRAGREDLAGQVILQTHYPDHPALQAMLTEPYSKQARRLLAARQASALPPWGQMALLRTDCSDAATGEDFLRQLRAQAEPLLASECQLIGPLPSPLQRRAGKYRWQLILTGSQRAPTRAAIRLLVATAGKLPQRRGLNWSIDVDPSELS